MASCKISLIIPVYNKESYLHDCLRSVCKQSINKEELEVLLVNDGSTDGSLDICREYAQKYPFFRVIDKPNGGVSSARNAGIRAARGEFLAFLDADDSLTPGSLEAIVSTFEQYRNDTDVVSFHIAYHHAGTGDVTYHKRDKWLAKTGLYDLSEFPYISQTTMNIAVKNRPENPIFFNEDMKMGEDQRFVTENLVRKGALAYCAEAEYGYVRDSGTAASVGNNPLYAYEDMIELFSYFMSVAKSCPHMALYAYHVLLHNVAWRLKGDKLFPVYCSGDERVRQEQRLADILSAIPAEAYGRSPYLDRSHKAFLMKKYGIIEPDTEVSFEGKKSLVSFPSRDYVWKTTTPILTAQRMVETDDAFVFRFRLSCPVFLLNDRISLEAKLGDSWQALVLERSSYDYHRSKEKTAKAFIVNFEVPLSILEDNPRIEFRAKGPQGEVKGLRLSLNRKVAALRTNSFVRDEEVWVFPSYRVRTKGKKLMFSKMSPSYKRKQSLSLLKRDRDILSVRTSTKRALRKFRNKEVWVYADLPSSVNGGNALLQLLHDLGRNDGVSRFYVCDAVDEVVIQHPELRGLVLPCGSKEHRVATLAASLVLTSYKERFIFCPFTVDEWARIGDLSRNTRVVYLQHGVLHAHLPWYLGYDRTLFDYAVISTGMERRVLMGDYAYPPAALLETGAPRLDELWKTTKVEKKKKIAFVPSWRGYLVQGTGEERIPCDKQFLSSSFYKGLVSFVEAVAQSGILRKYGYELDLKLHPNFRCYERHFEFDLPGVNVVFGAIHEGEYAVAITDFSSYIYDFIYAGARVMYYLPDEKEFRAGLNQYRELEVPLDDAFGPYSADFEEAVSNLDGILKDLDAGVVSRFAEKADRLFLHHDDKACERLYDELIKVSKA
ncbi:MAG: glycosyltransferase [Coriobacteriia bacterium]|nr:glycosyltransferase [Coriobacteriia bacterium]